MARPAKIRRKDSAPRSAGIQDYTEDQLLELGSRVVEAHYVPELRGSRRSSESAGAGRTLRSGT